VEFEASSDTWKDGFKTLTNACKSCHESFRAEEKEHGHH
jgi:cytochrome c556